MYILKIYIYVDKYQSLWMQQKKTYFIYSCNIFANPSALWFKSVPIRNNILDKMMKTMCEKAEIFGGYTNHSLRAYGATTLFQAQVPEKLIQQGIK